MIFQIPYRPFRPTRARNTIFLHPGCGTDVETFHRQHRHFCGCPKSTGRRTGRQNTHAATSIFFRLRLSPAPTAVAYGRTSHYQINCSNAPVRLKDGQPFFEPAHLNEKLPGGIPAKRNETTKPVGVSGGRLTVVGSQNGRDFRKFRIERRLEWHSGDLKFRFRVMQPACPAQRPPMNSGAY